MWLALHTLGPALAAYYSGILIMGLMGRMLPQLNQFTSGLSVNVLLFWGALFLTTSGGIWVLQDDLPELTGYLSRELAR
jgi:flagellar biosynthesis protein FliR